MFNWDTDYNDNYYNRFDRAAYSGTTALDSNIKYTTNWTKIHFDGKLIKLTDYSAAQYPSVKNLVLRWRLEVATYGSPFHNEIWVAYSKLADP